MQEHKTFHIVILILLSLNLLISMANYVKPLQAVVIQGFARALGEASGENLILRSQLQQANQEIQKLQDEAKNKK